MTVKVRTDNTPREQSNSMKITGITYAIWGAFCFVVTMVIWVSLGREYGFSQIRSWAAVTVGVGELGLMVWGILTYRGSRVETS